MFYDSRRAGVRWLMTAILMGLVSASALGAEHVVPSAAAVRAGLASLPDRFAATGNQVKFVFGTAGGTRDRVHRVSRSTLRSPHRRKSPI